jgi:hypothetical protein
MDSQSRRSSCGLPDPNTKIVLSSLGRRVAAAVMEEHGDDRDGEEVRSGGARRS